MNSFLLANKYLIAKDEEVVIAEVCLVFISKILFLIYKYFRNELSCDNRVK